jgi:hypothetical protein
MPAYPTARQPRRREARGDIVPLSGEQNSGVRKLNDGELVAPSTGFEPVFPCCLRRPLQNQELRHSDRRITAGDGNSGRVSGLLPSSNAARGVWYSVAGLNRGDTLPSPQRPTWRSASWLSCDACPWILAALTAQKADAPAWRLRPHLRRLRRRLVGVARSAPCAADGSRRRDLPSPLRTPPGCDAPRTHALFGRFERLESYPYLPQPSPLTLPFPPPHRRSLLASCAGKRRGPPLVRRVIDHKESGLAPPAYVEAPTHRRAILRARQAVRHGVSSGRARISSNSDSPPRSSPSRR